MEGDVSCTDKTQKEAQGFAEVEDQKIAFEISRWKCQLSGKIK